MEYRKAIAAVGVIMLLFLVTACGEPEPEGECPPSCDDGNPCTSDVCDKDTGFQCRSRPIPGCDAACGAPCTGSAGKYMTMQCDTEAKQCAADVSSSTKISPTPLVLEQSSRGVKFRVELLMNQPFNLQRDTIELKVSARELPSSVNAVKVKSVEMTGQTQSRQTVIIGSADINKEIFGTSASVEDELRATFPTSDYDGTYSNLKLALAFEYFSSDYGETVEGDAAILVRGQDFEWFKPTVTPKCPESCDDGNPATKDVCSSATDYFCEHQPISGQCGNTICESSEDKCSCEEDCGPCIGDASEHLSYECISNKCSTVLKPGVIQEPVSIFDDRNLKFFYLQNTYSFNNPFNVNTDKISLDFNLFDIGENYQDVTINSIRLLERDKTYASSDQSRSMSTAGETFSVELPIVGFAGEEETKTLSLKVWYEYGYISGNETIPKSGTYTKSLGQITLINPTG
jgi:hypothetical protein